MGEVGLRVRGLSKRYRRRRHRGILTLKTWAVERLRGRRSETPAVEEFWALRDIDFEVEGGTMLGIIGSNGAGKTTLLKCLAGITKPTEGVVEAAGRLGALIELGAGFHPEISGRENIFVNGIILGMTRREIRRKFDDIVEFSGLRQFIDEPVRTYSSGMFLRLAFAIAIHADPEIMIIDEIIAVGDQAFNRKCTDAIQRLKDSGKTIVLVTHDLGAIEKYCDEALWLAEGRMRDRGHPRRIVDQYLSYVAEEGHEVVNRIPEPGLVGADAAQQPQATGSAPTSARRRDRWGTREVELTDVRILRRGEVVTVLSHGDPMVIEMDYRCRRRIDKPVFGIGIFRSDGIAVYQTNTFLEHLEPGAIEGEGTVRIAFPALELLAGDFELDVAVHTSDGVTFDYHLQRYGFTVHPDADPDGTDLGIYRPAHRWYHESAGRTARLMPYVPVEERHRIRADAREMAREEGVDA